MRVRWDAPQHLGEEGEPPPELGLQQKLSLKTFSTPDMILQRLLSNLSSAFSGLNREEDARLIAELKSTLG